MPLPFDIEIRLFSRATGLRLAFNPDTVLSVDWELVEAGGAGQINVQLAVPFETLPAGNGDIIEVWAQNTGETVPRVRGIVNTPERGLDLKETHKLIAFGRMEDMNHVLLDKIVVHFEGADLAIYAAELFSDYQQRKNANASPQPRLVQDIQTTGITLQQLTATNTTVRDALNHLFDQSGANCVWGWDIDPATGLDRFYFRPRSTATIGHQFFVGNTVKLISAPSELAPVTNGIKIQGGPAQSPNYLTNSSYEVPTAPTGETGDLLQDGGFESGSAAPGGWTYVSGASRTQDNGFVNHSAHTGTWEVPLDQVGKEVWQEVAVTPGVQYVGTLFFARQNQNTAATGSLIVEGRNAAGTVVETYTLPLAPASTAWTGGQGTTVLASDGASLPVTFQSSTITHARVRVVCTAGTLSHGLMIDDVVFTPSTAVGQTGWSTHLQNPASSSNKFNSIDWGSRAAAWDGYYGLRLNVTADSSDKPVLAPFPGDNQGASGNHFKPMPQESLVCAAMVRMAPGSGAGQVNMECRSWRGDGHENDFQTAGYTIPADGNWHLAVYQPWSIHGDTVSATCQLTFAASGIYDVDAFSARNVAGFPQTLAAIAGGNRAAIEAAYRQEYLRGTNFETYVTAESLCTAGTAAYNSASLYGRREAVVSNPDIVTWNADAIAWALAYFQLHAVLLTRPRVELLHEPAQIPAPGDASLVRISGTGNDLPDEFLARAQYAWKASCLRVSLELSSERPTTAKILKSIMNGGGGSAASSTGTTAAAGSQQGVGTTTPAIQPTFQTDTFLATAQPGGVFGAGPYALTQTPSGLVMVYGDAGFIIPSGYAVASQALTFAAGVPYAQWQTITVVYQYTPSNSSTGT